MIGDITSGNGNSIYLNVVARINEDYERLIQHLQETDRRAIYLLSFEMSLSPALSKPLWETEAYKRQAAEMPMPSDPYESMDIQSFRAWMTLYELVMREEGLIGTKQRTIVGLDGGGG